MRSSLALAVAFSLAGAAALAGPMSFDARLTAGAESPSTGLAATGSLTASLDTTTRVLTYEARFAGLTGQATTAGFCSAARGGRVGPTLIALSDASSPVSGHATLTPAQASDLENGRWCFNVSTAAHPAGEIGGRIRRYVDPAQAAVAPGTGQDLNDLYRPPSASLGMQ